MYQWTRRTGGGRVPGWLTRAAAAGIIVTVTLETSAFAPAVADPVNMRIHAARGDDLALAMNSPVPTPTDQRWAAEYRLPVFRWRRSCWL